MRTRKVGVEEELMLLDPETGRLTAVATSAIRAHDEASQRIEVAATDSAGVSDRNDNATHELAAAEATVEAELFLQQLESHTPPTHELDELRLELGRSRRAMAESAQAAGAAAVAVATPVLVDREASVSPGPRYHRILDEFGELARGSLACAMHVHVEVDQAEEGVQVLDGVAPWLPVLCAISANSPYYHGRDTNYASWRSEIWSRWPSQGTRQPFGSNERYDEVTHCLIEWGAALDDAMTYFDARLARDYPTAEIRVADVCTDLDDAVLVAALARALVSTAASATPEPWRSELLRAASWRAARYGLGGNLVNPATRSLARPRDAVRALVDHVRPALEETGDLGLVEDHVDRLFTRGNGATVQRRTFEREGSLEAVVADLADRTNASWGA